MRCRTGNGHVSPWHCYGLICLQLIMKYAKNTDVPIALGKKLFKSYM